MSAASKTQTHDVIVIGAGFAGIYLVHRLRNQLGLDVQVFEKGDEVGGTWYWNRYPGARCDVESMFYCYTFDEDLLKEWRWTERYPAQSEILAYARHAADRFDVRRSVQFNTGVERAEFDEGTATWTVRTDKGTVATARFLITAVGCLSASQTPEFAGLETFKGETYHTGQWPHSPVDFSGKRVGVIGTGSSGIQAIPVVAQQAEHLTVFQRTPNFSVPARNRPLTEDELGSVRARYGELHAEARQTPAGTIMPAPIGSALELDDETVRRELEKRWQVGGTGVVAAFTDTVFSLDANEKTAEFVRERIRDIVEDPETAELLSPRSYPISTKRICVDTDYYATYNRNNVTLIDIKDTPIERITPAGVVVDGTEYELDALVFATGYDAMTGPLNRIEIAGRGGQLLREKWSNGPTTYLGLATHGFPNLFMVTGPGSPSVLGNMFVAIEQHVEWITDYIATLDQNHVAWTEANQNAEDNWVAEVNELASRTLHMQASTWYLGANVPGKPRVFMPYIGGYANYRSRCDGIAAAGYPGFRQVTNEGTTVLTLEETREVQPIS